MEGEILLSLCELGVNATSCNGMAFPLLILLTEMM